MSVAERISELEKQQHQQQMRYTYLDPEKRHRVSDPTLKAIQKKALLSFYERHHQSSSSWRSEPQLTQGTIPAPQSPPPQPPPRPRPPSSRRASSASDYASGNWREKINKGQNNCDLPSPKHQHSNSCGSLSTDLLGPVIVGPAISIDDWVPERPPKNPHLRNVYNERIPSPDLPPPSPPTITENEVICDDPLPPPPPELSDDSLSDCSRKESTDSQKADRNKSERRSSLRRSKRDHKSKSPGKSQDKTNLNDEMLETGFPNNRTVTGRSSLRYSQKLIMNGKVAPVRKIEEMTSRPPAQLPDLVTQRYDSVNQRAVETRIIRQESIRIEMVDSTGLMRNDVNRLESSQRRQSQISKNGEKIHQQPMRPNYLPILENSNKSKNKNQENGSHNFSMGSPVKTGYEANSKYFSSDGSPQKYHEPPKYVSNHHPRHGESTQRNYYALPPKYVDPSKQKPQPQCPSERFNNTGSSNSPPPPLAPRQNIPGRKSLPPPPRPAPPHTIHG